MRTINRILVANRGEIALRVCRTATDMGISTIAVYADQDMAAPHTREADEALSLGGDDAASTYLNGEKILAIALETGADAIHPGYGFLSENSDFARAVEDAGIAWLGPASDVIDALGDKIKARRVAEACGVVVRRPNEALIFRIDKVFVILRNIKLKALKLILIVQNAQNALINSVPVFVGTLELIGNKM